MNDIFLNDFHRERSERLKKQLAQQPKASLEDAMRQYDLIKRGSSLRKTEENDRRRKLND